ncbi:MAG: ABC transporter substrate-binding protein [Thermomicrobiales bacterium]
MRKLDYTRRDLLRRSAALAALTGGATLVGASPLARLAAAQDATPAAVTLPEITNVPEKLMGSGEVIVASWGGAVLDAQLISTIEPFQELTGISVTVAESPDPSKIKAMVDTGNIEWDVVWLGLGDVLALDGYFEEMDYSYFDLENISPEFVGTHSLASVLFAEILAYRTDAYPEAPQNWTDFWDVEKFPGGRAMPAAAQLPFVEAAVMAAGVPKDEVYPIDLDLAFESFDKIKPHVVKWWEAGAQPPQMLTDNEVPMSVAFNGRITPIQQAGAPVGIQWNQGLLARDDLAIIKGAPNLENAYKFCAFASLPAPQARFSMQIPYGFVNTKAAELIPADILATLPTSPEILPNLLLRDEQWWAANRGPLLDRWNEWILE